jgi:hypothetical protein
MTSSNPDLEIANLFTVKGLVAVITGGETGKCLDELLP